MSPQSDYDKWIKLSEMLREEDVTRKAQVKDIAQLMKRVLPETPSSEILKRVIESLLLHNLFLLSGGY